MGEEPGTASAPVTDPKDPDQIREDIEATRRELGDTVEALVAKTDVKAHAPARIERAKASAPSPVVLVVVAALVVGVVAWRLTKRH